MPEFETPTCDDGHLLAEMNFLESYDPLSQPTCGVDTECTEWQKRWRYACPECGRVIEIREAPGGGFRERTVRGPEKDARTDPTSLNPVKE